MHGFQARTNYKLRLNVPGIPGAEQHCNKFKPASCLGDQPLLSPLAAGDAQVLLIALRRCC